MALEPCTLCNRTMADLRRDLSVQALRGSRPLCPVRRCPIVERLSAFAAPAAVKGRELEGPSPNVFVGAHGYPDVRAGPLATTAAAMDPLLATTPAHWVDEDMLTLVGLRARLLRGRGNVHVVKREDTTGLVDATRLAAMSVKPVDANLTLRKEVKDRGPRLDLFSAPMGPGVDVEKARVLGHPSVPRRVDALVSDTDAKAATAVGELQHAGIDAYHIERLLSVGLLGEGHQRRMVPTRWAITATDDMLGKTIIERLRDRQHLGDVRVHHAERFGNRFWVMLLPGPWAFELVEAWQVHGRWQVGADAEGYRGRTRYVDATAGAYYAARLSVAEHLEGLQRQASVVVAREITEDYWAPLGVWVIREVVRLAMDAKPLVFGDVAAAVAHVARQHGHPAWSRESKVLREARTQTRLSQFQDGD